MIISESKITKSLMFIWYPWNQSPVRLSEVEGPVQLKSGPISIVYVWRKLRHCSVKLVPPVPPNFYVWHKKGFAAPNWTDWSLYIWRRFKI